MTRVPAWLFDRSKPAVDSPDLVDSGEIQHLSRVVLNGLARKRGEEGVREGIEIVIYSPGPAWSAEKTSNRFGLAGESSKYH
jgi:hypothetical protein